MATAPVPRLDGAAIQIKNLLYVFAGYGTIDYVRISKKPSVSFCVYLGYYSITSQYLWAALELLLLVYLEDKLLDCLFGIFLHELAYIAVVSYDKE